MEQNQILQNLKYLKESGSIVKEGDKIIPHQEHIQFRINLLMVC